MKKSDLWFFILISILSIIVVVTSQYLYNYQNNSCIADPLGYSIKYYEKNIGEIAYGVIYFHNGNKPYNYITFSKEGFNMTSYG